MGLFSSKKKTYVSAVVYPLGGEAEDLPDTLQSTIFQGVLENRNLGEHISSSYLTGRGMKLRTAFRYARDHFPLGLPTSNSVYVEQPNLAPLVQLLQGRHKGSNIQLLSTLVGVADYAWFAEQYLAEQFGYDIVAKEFFKPPKGVARNAVVSYDLEANGLIRILLVNPNNHVTVVNFRPTGLERMANYVHAAYRTEQVFQGAGSRTQRPFVTGDTDTVQTFLEVIERVGETQETTTQIVTQTDGVTTTISTGKTTRVISRPKYFIYRLGAGQHASLDRWLTAADLQSPYFPAIPIRVNNKDWTSAAYRNTPLYKSSQRLCTKLGFDFQDVADSVNESESIKDIDYAFITAGVMLNTPTQAGKQYLFAFFQYLRNISKFNKAAYKSWENNHRDDLVVAPRSIGIQNTSTTSVVSPETNVLEIYSNKDRNNNYDIKLQWQYIEGEVKTGKAFANAKVGEVSITVGGTPAQYFLGFQVALDATLMHARRQLTENTYEELEICGLYYDNYVYNGKSVSISAWEAFNDEDKEGFLVPLSQQVFRSLSMVTQTQLAGECLHIVFNCYQVVKQRWYQRGVFKVILVIAAIVITVMSGFVDGGHTLMATLALTAAQTFTTIALLVSVLAATIYVLSLIVLTRIFTYAGTRLFGEKIGSIVAAIATIVVAGLPADGGTSALALNAPTILKGTLSVSQLYGAYVQGSLAELQQEMLEAQDAYKGEMKEIEELTKELMGGNNLDTLDIFGYMEASQQYHYESPAIFLERTLLLGSDVAMITDALVTNFAEIGLYLPDQG